MAPPRLKLVTDESKNPKLDRASPADGAREGQLRPSAREGVPEAALAALAAERAAREAQEADRIVEAILFAASRPLDEAAIARQSGPRVAVADALVRLQATYAARGVNLVRVAGKWAFRTADDLSWLLEAHTSDERKLSRAALETLAIIAYHQPVTRAEVEDIRGVTTSKGTLDVLLETGWVRPRGRRRAPGRPVTYGTTEAFLAHFSLDTIKDLPGLAELKGTGLLDGNLPPGFSVPDPTDIAALMPDELPLDAEGDEEPSGDLFDLPVDEADTELARPGSEQDGAAGDDRDS